MKILRVGSWKEGNVGYRYPCENVSSRYPEMGWKSEYRDVEKRVKERVSVGATARGKMVSLDGVGSS